MQRRHYYPIIQEESIPLQKKKQELAAHCGPHLFLRTALFNFWYGQFKEIERQFKEIERVGNEIQINHVDRDKVKCDFLDQLLNIDFLSAYKNAEIKRDHVNDNYTDASSLSDFIYTNKPELKNVENFVIHSLGMKDVKNTLIDNVKNIKQIINQYSSSNKKNIISLFNREIDEFIRALGKRSYLDVAKVVENGVKKILNKLEENNNHYYTQLFFRVDSRKKNSNLGAQINLAKQELKHLLNDKHSAKEEKTSNVKGCFGWF